MKRLNILLTTSLGKSYNLFALITGIVGFIYFINSAKIVSFVFLLVIIQKSISLYQIYKNK